MGFIYGYDLPTGPAVAGALLGVAILFVWFGRDRGFKIGRIIGGLACVVAVVLGFVSPNPWAAIVAVVSVPLALGVPWKRLLGENINDYKKTDGDEVSNDPDNLDQQLEQPNMSGYVPYTGDVHWRRAADLLLASKRDPGYPHEQLSVYPPPPLPFLRAGWRRRAQQYLLGAFAIGVAGDPVCPTHTPLL